MFYCAQALYLRCRQRTTSSKSAEDSGLYSIEVQGGELTFHTPLCSRDVSFY